MRTFGKYQLVERIGAGGMAEVFLAKNYGAEGLEKMLVLKRIRPEYARKPRFVSMFIDEAKIAVSLNHPNVVQVYEFGRVGSDYYLAMEYVEGVDLSQVLLACRTQNRQFPVADAVYIAIEIAKALDYAHRKRNAYGAELGIVHRDVSPQNILISRDGTVKLLDFGIAKAAHSLEKGVGEIEGKVSYMSPEQARGDAVDGRSDLFALGIVLWEMLVGRPLFPFTNNAATLTLVKNVVVPDVRSEVPWIADRLASVVGKVLAGTRDARHSSARELQVALTRWLFEAGTVADSVSLSAFLASIGFNQRNVWLSAAIPALPRPAPAPTVAPQDSGPMRTEVVIEDNATPGLLDDEDDALQTDSMLSESLTSNGTGTIPAPEETGVGTGDVYVSTSAGSSGKRVERTEAVLLCGDLRGFAALRSGTGHERWQHVLLDYIRIVEALAFKTEAIVDRVGENGFTLLLGIPISSENDAERAMQLSADLIEAVDGMNLNLESPLQLSIGGLVGSVVVEHQVEHERKYDWFYDDETAGKGGLYVAEALARAGMGREVLIGGRIFRRVRRRYHVEEIEPVAVDLDGDEKELTAYRLLGPLSVREHLRAVKHSYRRIIGREIELNSLRRSYRDVRMLSRTRAVLLTGEHGVGKSTLVQEFISGLKAGPNHARRVDVFQSIVDLRDKDRVYGALVSLIREVLRVGRDADTRQILSRLKTMVETLLGHLSEQEREYVVQSLAFLLGVKVSRNVIEQLDPEHRRARIGSSLRRMIRGLASDRPVVFAIEDLHNADPSSLEFLADHMERGQQVPVMFVMTSLVIEPERSTQWRKLLLSTNLTVEPLGELAPHAARDMASGLLPELLAADDTLVMSLMSRAGNNPLYLKEMVELIEERGGNDLASAHRLLNSANPSTTGELASSTDSGGAWLPTTVEGLMTSRLDRLPVGAKQTLQRCGLLGRRFTFSKLSAMLGVDEDEPALDTMRQHLSMLVERGFLIADSAADVETSEVEPSETTQAWSFASAVIMEVAAHGVVEPERSELHARIAYNLLDRVDSLYSVDFGEVAYHLDAAGEPERAGEMYLMGAEQALDSVGGDECLRQVEKALERLSVESEHYASGLELKERALALLGRPVERQETLDVLLDLLETQGSAESRKLKVRTRAARLMYDRGRLDEAEALVSDSLNGARSIGDKRLEGSALRLLVMVYRDTGRREQALEMVTEAIACFEEAGDVEGLWAALLSQGIALRQGGDTHKALQSYQRALHIIEGHNFRRQEQTTLINMGLLYASLGRLGKALDNYNRALTSVRDLGHMRDEGALLANMGHLYMLAGDYTQAQRLLTQSVGLSRKSRDKLALADGVLTLGFVLLARDRVREAAAMIKKGHRLAKDIHNVYLIAHGLLGLAEAQLDASGDTASFEKALELARKAAQLGQDSGLNWTRSRSASLEALALFRLGQIEEATELSRTTVSMLEEGTVAQDLEILARHIEIVQVSNPEEAMQTRVRARQLVDARLVAIGDSQMRKTFSRTRLVRWLLHTPS